MVKGLMIAAPQSGSGKTIVTLALLRTLADKGIRVCAAKVGPDYIDPSFHEIASNSPSVNLDAWAMSGARCRQLVREQVEDNDYFLVEAMMGLFDGAADGSGSAAYLAGELRIPVILVVDVAGQSHSVAALVHGFCNHRPDIKIGGVILNRVGGVRHETMLREALERIHIPVIGAIRKNDVFALPKRHLGLVQAREISEIEGFIANAAEEVEKLVDWSVFESCFWTVNLDDEGRTNSIPPARVPPPGQNIAIAFDEAFSFIYPHLKNDWRRQGARISFFSPLANEGPPNDVDAVFLPGGYPELHAGKISGATNFSALMSATKNRGALIYGECGGYMTLGKGITDAQGTRHAMLGFLDLETDFEKRKLHLGYRYARARGTFFAGAEIVAHEFHYTTALQQKGESLFDVCNAIGENMDSMGLRKANVMGSYLHLVNVREQDG